MAGGAAVAGAGVPGNVAERMHFHPVEGGEQFGLSDLQTAADDGLLLGTCFAAGIKADGRHGTVFRSWRVGGE